MSTEVELKFSVPPRAAREAARLPWLRKLTGGPVRRSAITSIYFDTEHFELRRNGLTLRTRKIGGRRLQTVKRVGASASGREEWEEEIAGDTPDFKRAKRTALRPLLTRKLKSALRPVFEAEVQRIAIPLRIGQSDVEVAIDHGAIKTGGARAPISEIELELKDGKPRDLVSIARRLRKVLPIAYEPRSKSERGYALSAGAEHEPIGPEPIRLAPNASTGTAFTLIGLSCLHHLAANAGAVGHRDSEGVHQMRVGLRRLRAAISVFRDVVQNHETENVKTQLKWLTEQLGPARDFDVFLQEAVAPLRDAIPDKAAIKLLESDLKEKRERSFEKAIAAVEGERYRRLVLETALWLIDGEWLRDDDALAVARRELPIAPFARDVLSARTRKIVKKSRKVEELDARRRHRLRIAVKKLRYATAFFAGLFGKAKARRARVRFEQKLKALQRALGNLNDIAVHQSFARQYTRAAPKSSELPQKAFAVGVLTGCEQSRARACVIAAGRSGKRLAKVDAFWRSE